jgi:beta-catenin-like protein 1
LHYREVVAVILRVLPCSERSIDQMLEEAEESGVAVAALDRNSLKQLLAALDKKITKNQELRAKYAPHTPDKFMDSELELHTAIEELYPVAASPELFPYFITQLAGLSVLLGLVIHENTDISLAVITLLQEMCDSEMIQQADEEGTDATDNVIARSLVGAFKQTQGLEVVVQNLSRLDENNNAEDATGVYNTLSIIENLVELDSSIAVDVCEKTHFLKFLLKRLNVKEYDANKLYCSELLSQLLQADPSVPRYTVIIDFVGCCGRNRLVLQ